MLTTNPRNETSMRLAADLDAKTASEAHDRILSLLEMAEASDENVTLELGSDDGMVSPLSLQLLASAAQSFPDGRLIFGPHAAAALAALEQPKEI